MKKIPDFGAIHRRACGCLSQYGLWARNTGSWSVRIMCGQHATPDYLARVAGEAAQECRSQS